MSQAVAIAAPVAPASPASPAELIAAQQYLHDLIEEDASEVEWSVGMVCSVRPDPERDRTNADFHETIRRLKKAMRLIERQAFGVEVDIAQDYERRPDGSIAACLLTVRWPRRPLVLRLPDAPIGQKATRGKGNRGGDLPRA